jgi:formate dehydrogenase iron-sulfur subunit
MGCRSCQVACKAWNDNPGELTQCLGCYDNPPDFSAKTWSLIQFDEVEFFGKLNWVFSKRQCMHCEHPACVSACPVQALHKLDEGPVVYEADRCIGCRYCMVACPFHVPRIDFYELLPPIKKCTFCVDRVSEGLEPACVKACPTDALTFGGRDELVTEAKRRIAARPNKYIDHIYGEKEAGGTSWMYISPVPFDTLRNFPALSEHPVPEISENVAIYGTPTALIAVAGALAGVYFATKGRNKNGKEET